MARRAAFPGTFDPLTTGHLAIADAAHAELGLDRVDLVISHDPIGKEATASVEERLEVIARQGRRRPWLAGRATAHRLVADIADGYDVVVLGADKWLQLHDVSYYGSAAAMAAALARLPAVAVAPRAGVVLPDDLRAHVLGVPEEFHHISSTAVRAGRHDWKA